MNFPSLERLPIDTVNIDGETYKVLHSSSVAYLTWRDQHQWEAELKVLGLVQGNVQVECELWETAEARASYGPTPTTDDQPQTSTVRVVIPEPRPGSLLMSPP